MNKLIRYGSFAAAVVAAVAMIFAGDVPAPYGVYVKDLALAAAAVVMILAMRTLPPGP